MTKTRNPIVVQEDRKLATFHITPTWNLIGTDRPNEYEGWENSATWCFNLYFMQESKLQNKLAKLFREDGTINYKSAQRLFDTAQKRQGGLSMEQIDADSEGEVSVCEIVDNFVEERGPQIGDEMKWIEKGKFRSLDHLYTAWKFNYGLSPTYYNAFLKAKKFITSGQGRKWLRYEMRLVSQPDLEDMLRYIHGELVKAL